MIAYPLHILENADVQKLADILPGIIRTITFNITTPEKVSSIRKFLRDLK